MTRGQRFSAIWRKVLYQDDIREAKNLWQKSPESAKKFLIAHDIKWQGLFNKWQAEDN